jgi:hypothetical protein
VYASERLKKGSSISIIILNPLQADTQSLFKNLLPKPETQNPTTQNQGSRLGPWGFAPNPTSFFCLDAKKRSKKKSRGISIASFLLAR